MEVGEIDDIFRACDPEAVDLLRKMLIFNPDDRITIDEALKHDFIGDLHYEADEPTTVPVSAFDFDFEIYDLTIEEQKTIILDEMSLYHSKKAQKKYVKNKKKHPSGILYLTYGSYFDNEVEEQATPETITQAQKNESHIAVEVAPETHNKVEDESVKNCQINRDTNNKSDEP